MPTNYEIPVNSVLKIISTAAAAGIRTEKLCRHAKFDTATLEDADNQILFKQLTKFYQHAARLTGDDAFGLHVGERDSPKSYGLLGYVAINSRTVGEALNRLIRFQQIRTRASRFSLEIVSGRARLAYTYQTNDISPEERRHESEETLCSIMEFGRRMTGFNWIPSEVHFEHARPQNVSEHERIFRAPIRFGKPLTQFVFDSDFLKTPLAQADLTLGSLLERQAEELLAKSPKEEKTFVHPVRRLMLENLGGSELRMETVCRNLGSSKRTLQRKLTEEGSTYQKLLEETQYEMSTFYLRQPEITIGEISASLGFSEPSAFHRAFRRWAGITPQAFRHQKH
ncbi:MAG: AraC family transcriptional regulator [Acidobacteria bacterium]|nr:AraC family transcriptional regulator [Acidobacteriota bacterium]